MARSAAVRSTTAAARRLFLLGLVGTLGLGAAACGTLQKPAPAGSGKNVPASTTIKK